MTRKAGTFLLVVFNLIAGFGLVISSIACLLDPSTYPTSVILAMSFPIWPPIAVVALLLNFFFARRWCIFSAVTFAVSLPMVFTTYPLNPFYGNPPKRLSDRSWTLLSYNILNYRDFTNEYTNGRNQTLQYIIDRNADVVVFEECEFPRDKDLRITPGQRDTLNRLYHYQSFTDDIGIYSKFPTRQINIGHIADNRQAYLKRAVAWELDIYGEKTLIIGVHLCSIGLTNDDKELYHDLTTGSVNSRNEINDVKVELIDKVGAAGAVRAIQADCIVDAIDRLGYKNVIVCGDFNDTPGCYALSALEKTGLSEVYPLVGTGYMYTYNANRFLFQIDHILSRGYWRPWQISRGDIKTSDHFPILATFVPSGKS